MSNIQTDNFLENHMENELRCLCEQDHSPFGICPNASLTNMCDDCTLNCAVGKIKSLKDVVRVYGSEKDINKFVLKGGLK